MPSSGFWFKVGRQGGTPEVSEAGGHINSLRTIRPQNGKRGGDRETGRRGDGEKESTRAIRWLGPQSRGERMQAQARAALGGWREGPGHCCSPTRGPRGGVGGSACRTLPGPAELRAPLVPPTTIASRGAVQGRRPALPRQPLALPFTEDCFNLTAQNESSVCAE